MPVILTAAMEQRTLDLLKQASTATITTQLLARGLRNTYLRGVRPLQPRLRMAGPAFTLRYIPAREDIDTLAVYQDYDHPQRRAIESVPPGHVLVMDCRGQGRAASAGGILATRLLVRGAAGLVTDGTLRDTPEIEKIALPAYAKGPSPLTNLAQHHAVDLQVPIGCAEVAVYPGDVMVGDAEGVVCVPAHLAAEVAEAAVEQEELERFIQREIEGGRPLRGTYPPDAETRARYARARGGEAGRPGP
jgi:regulator of RNase E activity RraA